ncbi:MAG: succinate dehydrogenase assembly factor 4 [Pseudomonadota bacterium]
MGTDTRKTSEPTSDDKPTATPNEQKPTSKPTDVKEIGGPKGPEPTRYGDWEKGGRCSDF